MTGRDILQQRLVNQQLAQHNFTKPHQLVSYMGCMQAQDFYSSKWAIGARMKGATDAMIEKEFSEGQILRTHVLRPTWHLVSPDDISWMLELTAPKIKMITAGYLGRQGIDRSIVLQSKKIFENALCGGKQLSREELSPLFKSQHIKTSDNHLSFLLLEAELDGMLCSGARKGKHFTYALLDERVPKRKQLERDEALAQLANRYFTSRGPATVADFAWWSGMNLTDAKKGLELNKYLLQHETVNGQVYWFKPATLPAKAISTALYLLPAFDEYGIAYKDRSLSMEAHHTFTTNNGIFKPIVINKGRIAATWKRTEKNDKLLIDIEPFSTHLKLSVQKLNTAAKRYGKFLGKKYQVNLAV